MGRFILIMVMLGFSFGQNGTALAATQNVACSANDLIAALENANTNPGDDILNLQAGCIYMLSEVNNTEFGPNGLPVIDSSATAGKLTINGNGAKLVRGVYLYFFIPLVLKSSAATALTTSQPAPAPAARRTATTTASAAPDFRILMVDSGGDLTLDNLTVMYGSIPGQDGGGIYNGGTLAVNDSTLTSNTADFGGGIFNAGTLAVNGSSFSGNTAAVAGGGINSSGDLTLSGSTFSSNSASLGDGILVAGGTYAANGNTFTGDSSFTCPTFPVTVPAGDSAGLISAMQCANSDTVDNVINLTSSTYTLTAVDNSMDWGPGPNGLPVVGGPIAGKLTINGNGATIARSSAGGTPEFRIFLVSWGANLTLDHVTLKNGKYTAGNDLFDQGNGSGILNFGTLTINNSTITNNIGFMGGGISSDQAGTLTITNSTISNNTSLRDGAGINNASTLTINNSVFSGNTSQGLAGGIIIGHNTATVTNTTFSGNSAAAFAGGGGLIAINDSVVTVTGCTFSGNHVDNSGGAIFNASNSLTVVNSTFTNNSAGYDGGAIWNGGVMTITHSTISGNSASYIGGGIRITGGTVNLGSTIVAGNAISIHLDGGLDIDNTTGDNLGALNSLGYNLIGSTTDTAITGSTTGNLLDAAAAPLNLGSLQNNGGPTQTMALGPGSVAINAGDPAFAPPPAYDQRGIGYPRVVGGRIDIGAYER